MKIIFSDPYCDLIESLGEPDEPLREIANISSILMYHDSIQTWDKTTKDRDWNLATISWCEITENPKYTTSDGKSWAEMSIEEDES